MDLNWNERHVFNVLCVCVCVCKCLCVHRSHVCTLMFIIAVVNAMCVL